MASTELTNGQKLQNGKYEIVRVLGQGGFGITYEGIQTGLGRKVAIKEFFMKEYCERDADTSQVSIVGTNDNRSWVEKFKEKFVKEAQMIAGLEDIPRIIRIYDIFQENGTAYYVMQYIDGGSLDSKVKTAGALKEKEAIGYILQIADALGQLHAQKIMHLDIKPSNVLLKGDHVFLIDFGISKHYDTEGLATTTTPVGRSKGYAPIEQYRQGGVQSFSPETDIYSLGATAYFLVTGQTPPEATELIAEPLQRPTGISDALWNAISISMSASKNSRPHSIEEFTKLLSDSEGADMEPSQEVSVDTDVTIIDTEISKIEDIKVFEVGGVSFKMIRVKAGTFQMGLETGYEDEKPVHSVVLTQDYYIGETEVTQALWQAVMENDPSYYKGDNRPVECVSWYDCQEFIRKLNAETGKNFRLPTEAEWEYAAKGGNKSKGYTYAGSNSIEDVAWYDQNAFQESIWNHCTPAAVKTKSPNELGLYDMSGNVAEWCQDRYAPYSRGNQTDPEGSSSGSSRVLRGGGYSSRAKRCQVASRDYHGPGYRSSRCGLRLALVP